jgi:hypothetical protein
MSANQSNQSNQNNQIILPQESDMSTLSSAIVEWRRLNDECSDFKQQIKERMTKIRALQEVIVRIMKSHNVAALDLKNTGGRVITKQRKSQSGLTAKTLHSQLATYLKSEEEATKALQFIQSNRTVSTRDALMYEKP